jgi:hypothetical protein
VLASIAVVVPVKLILAAQSLISVRRARRPISGRRAHRKGKRIGVKNAAGDGLARVADNIEGRSQPEGSRSRMLHRHKARSIGMASSSGLGLPSCVVARAAAQRNLLAAVAGDVSRTPADLAYLKE